MRIALYPAVNTLVASVFLLCIATSASASGQQGKQCSKKTLDSSYGFTLTGTTTTGNNAGPRAAVGEMTFDGNGGFIGSETQSKNGVITQNLQFNGSYSVNADCTGKVTFISPEGEFRNGDIVILNQESEIFGIQTDDGRTVTFDAKRKNQGHSH